MSEQPPDTYPMSIESLQNLGTTPHCNSVARAFAKTAMDVLVLGGELTRETTEPVFYNQVAAPPPPQRPNHPGQGRRSFEVRGGSLGLDLGLGLGYSQADEPRLTWPCRMPEAHGLPSQQMRAKAAPILPTGPAAALDGAASSLGPQPCAPGPWPAPRNHAAAPGPDAVANFVEQAAVAAMLAAWGNFNYSNPGSNAVTGVLPPTWGPTQPSWPGVAGGATRPNAGSAAPAARPRRPGSESMLHLAQFLAEAPLEREGRGLARDFGERAVDVAAAAQEQELAEKESLSIPQQRFRAQFRKTQLCRYFRTSECWNGRQCDFAHGEEELRSPPDLNKTSLCKLWELGKCPLSVRECEFAHGVQDLRATSVYAKTSLCKQHYLGKCSLGDRCRHAHSPSEIQTPVFARPLRAKMASTGWPADKLPTEHRDAREAGTRSTPSSGRHDGTESVPPSRVSTKDRAKRIVLSF